MRKTLKALCDTPSYAEQSQKAAQLFLDSPLYRRAPLILAFVSLKTEIDTHPLIEKIMSDGKKVAVPLTSDTSMFFKLLQKEKPLSKQLRCGNFGIEEPVCDLKDISPETLPAGTVILVPGLAFSAGGARLGKGKGYHDRYLEHVPAETILAGYAFQVQVLQDVPCEPHDRKVGYLVTDERIIHTADE